jgi:integrase
VFEAQGPSGWWEGEIPKHDPSPNLRPIKVKADHVDNGMLVVAAGKKKKVRRVPLDPELGREIRSWIGRLVHLEQPGSFNRRVRHLSLTGVPFHPHQMRHTFACRWLERGGSLAALQAILGHSTIVTTQRYARLSDDHVRAEVERISGSSVASSVAS